MASQSSLRLPLAVVQEDSPRATRGIDHEGNSDGAESGGQRFPPLFRLPLPILRPFGSGDRLISRSRYWFQVSEEAHIHFRDAGAIIEEALPPSPSSPSYDAYMEKEKIAGRGLGGEGEGEEEHVVLDEKAALAVGLELEAAEVHVGEGDGDEDSEGGDGDGQGGGERGIADRERGGDEDEDRDGDGDGEDDGFGDFQGGGGGDGETVAGTGAVPIPNLLDTLKGIDGRGGLSMSYDSEVTEPEQHRDEGVDGVDARAGGGEEDWLGGLR